MAVSLVGLAVKHVSLLAFTYDLPALQQQLIETAGRILPRSGHVVRVGLDAKTTAGSKPRDQQQFAQQLQANKIEVSLIRGGALGPEYALVNRPVSGWGIQHAKAALIGSDLILGSCNWTTSSRANIEVGVHVKFTSQESSRLSEEWGAQILAGMPLREAAQLAEQRARSASPLRGASRSGRRAVNREYR